MIRGSFLVLALAFVAATAMASPQQVRVVSDDSGRRLQVDGRDFLVVGMNWDYVPIGKNYAYSLWTQPDDVIEEALENEMPLLQGLGVNAIRQYVGVPPRWVQYIYERWGIYTVLNHTVARYGYTLDGVWTPTPDYSDPKLRAALREEVAALVDEFRDTPGVLVWLLGNENNYGLTWSSFEIEALPEGERETVRARYLYSLFEEITKEIKRRDPNRPVAIANGDVQYLSVIAEECPSLDIFGTNVYRGVSARDLYDVVNDELRLPVLFTEFGADAFNAKEMREDQEMQCRYLVGQWQEIYEQTAGKGRTANCIGGLTFQWSDGWWKFGQESRLDIHDSNASWPNAGYREDFVAGQNNMNEEWWGITAKGRPDARGMYEVYPRAAYYALTRAFTLDAYGPGVDLRTIRAHFAAIHPAEATLKARGDRAALLAETTSRARLAGLRLEFETIGTGGERVSTPLVPEPDGGYPSFRGYDQLQSFYADFEASPSPSVTGHLSINVLGNVPTNPIDEIFYENRGRPRTVPTSADSVQLEDIERVKVYQAGVHWEDPRFVLEGFYRTGHYHWGYEGDFFGLYREANYGENIDIYNGVAPVGVEWHGKAELEGLAIAMGPELWWGANPAQLTKYSRRLGRVDATAIWQEDLAQQSNVTSSIAVPLPKTRKATLHLATSRGPFQLDVGGIWSGSTKVGDTFDAIDERPEGTVVVRDSVRTGDAFGAKAKLGFESGRWHWYAQSGYYGLVADGGPTQTITYTGWHLKDSGSGNQANFLTGLAVNVGRFQIGPNFLWQKPLVGPIPAGLPAPARPRNVLDDPFAVRANRETVGAELMLTYDPTPGSWLWEWDNDVREDAGFAASLGLVYRDFATTQDAAIGILADGRTQFAYPAATPARDLWELHARAVSRPNAETRAIFHAYGGTAEPNGDSARLVRRFGADAKVGWRSIVVESFAKFHDFGPYDYHRDGNLTYPAHVMGDLSYVFGAPDWLGHPQTRIGVRGVWRSLDENSPRFCANTVEDSFGVESCDPTTPGPRGNEWEIRSYLHFVL
ncbi:MAG: glycoside hydrolase family 2 TIM barrel-domain containing protein [bacterium]